MPHSSHPAELALYDGRLFFEAQGDRKERWAFDAELSRNSPTSKCTDAGV